MKLTDRNKSLTNLHKAADYLSRTLRENLKMFTVDATSNEVVFISEKQNVISCSYTQDSGKLVLSEMKVESVEDYTSGAKVDEKVTQGISEFVKTLREDAYDQSDISFTDVLGLFEQRSKTESLRYKVGKHLESFGSKTTVLETTQFTKLKEVKPLLIQFIKENKETLLKNEDIYSSLRIGSALAKAFALPKKSYEDLQEGSFFAIDLNEKSLYEMVCQQELVRQELLSAKEDFSNIWVSNQKIQELASCIYAKDDVVRERLAEVIEDVPYFAFSTKSSILETLTSVYEVNATDVISKKDIKEFSKKLYDWKKPVKADLVKVLSESYGINVNTLKFVPSFSNLAKAQSVMLEVLNLECEEGILSDVLSEFKKFLSRKGGVEILDVNDFILECFKEADVKPLQENLLMQYVDIPRLGKDLSALRTLLVPDAGAGMGEMGAEGEMMDEPVDGEEMPPEEVEGEAPEAGFEPEGGEVPQEGEEQEEGMPMNGEEEGMPPNGEEGMPPNGEEGMPGPNGEKEEFPVGDDSTDQVQSQPGASNPAQAEGDSLVSDLEKLIQGLGLGGNGRDEEEEEDEQYGA